MNVRVVSLRAVALAACLLTVAACTSSHESSSSSKHSASTSTTNVNDVPNAIPFVVGARVGLPHGWNVRVARVHRPYTNSRLPALPAGRQYVAVDFSMDNEGARTATVDAAELFTLGDSTGHYDRMVEVPGRPNGLDGTYPPGSNRAGRLVFDTPVRAELRLGLEGPKIGTQRAIFQIYPPTVPPGD